MKNIKIAKKGQIDIYSTFISSFYLSTYQDIVNIILSSPRHKYILEKYHFNPVEIPTKQRQYFKNLETLHLYTKEQNEFENDPNIKKRIYWHEISYSDYLKMKENNPNYEFKKIQYRNEKI